MASFIVPLEKILTTIIKNCQKEVRIQLVVLFLGYITKILLNNPSNSSIPSWIITEISIYSSYVLCWPVILDNLLLSLVYYSLRKQDNDKENDKLTKTMIITILLGSDCILWVFFYTWYLGVFPIYKTIYGGRLSGHWLAFGITNFMYVKTLTIVENLRTSDIKVGIKLIKFTLNFLMKVNLWTLFWTTVIYHTIFECFIGLLCSLISILSTIYFLRSYFKYTLPKEFNSKSIEMTKIG